MSNSTAQQIQIEPKIVMLLPEEVVIDEAILRARPMYDPQEEAKEVEELAKNIQRDTQLEPIVVRPVPYTAEPYNRFHLVAGRRRIDAGFFINSQKSKGEDQFRLAAVVNPAITEKDAFRAALSENLKRKNLSAIQFALVSKSVREENSWAGGKNTKKVADYLQVSPATVTQAEKLLTLPEDIQQQVHRGDLTAKAAFDILDVKEEKREEVLDKARQGQVEEERTQTTTEGTAVEGKGKKKPVQSKHVRRAARDTEGALDKAKPRSRKDIVEFFEMNDGPAYGHPNGAVRQFIGYFLKWTAGEGTDRTLTAKFDAMVEKADKGTPDSAGTPKTAKKAAKPATKKASKKPAKKK